LKKILKKIVLVASVVLIFLVVCFLALLVYLHINFPGASLIPDHYVFGKLVAETDDTKVYMNLIDEPYNEPNNQNHGTMVFDTSNPKLLEDLNKYDDFDVVMSHSSRYEGVIMVMGHNYKDEEEQAKEGYIERHAIFLGNFSINKKDDIYCSDLVDDDQNPWIVPNLTFKYMGD
jgi:hypothetical protein